MDRVISALTLVLTIVILSSHSVLSQSTTPPPTTTAPTHRGGHTTSTPTGPPLSDALESHGAGKFARNIASNVGGGEFANGTGTWFVPPDPNFTKRDPDSIVALLVRQAASNHNYLYQWSPYIIYAAQMRAYTGAIIPTHYTADAILDGRAQSVLSHGERDVNGGCNSTAPIHLFSGRGNNVTILQEDIPFQGGLIHLVSDFFTPPQSLSDSLLSSPLTTSFASYLSGNSSTFNSAPLVTVFAPSNAAILDAISGNQSLSASDITNLIAAHVVVGFAAYSPYLVEGAKFKSVAGPDINITTGTDGAIFVNDAEVIQSDIVVQNGVVHVVDELLFTPSLPTATAPAAFTGAAGWSAVGASQMDMMGVGVVVWSVVLCAAVAIGGAMAVVA